jgi:organic hydroperoxide reductase OsmC/OhrA
VAAERIHEYGATIRWAGSTKTYAGYSREHEIAVDGYANVLRASADAAFRGDPSRLNPEQLLVASLSSCHMLSYLACCALAGVEVLAYVDRARGAMSETAGAGRFVSVVLAPEVTLARAEDVERATALHGAAHEACFIANSVSFAVRHEPVTIVASAHHA